MFKPFKISFCIILALQGHRNRNLQQILLMRSTKMAATQTTTINFTKMQRCFNIYTTKKIRVLHLS